MLKYFGRVSKMGKDNEELKEYQPLLKDFKEPVQQIKVCLKLFLELLLFFKYT